MVGFAELLGSMPAVKQEPDVAEYTRHILDTGRECDGFAGETLVTVGPGLLSGRLTPSFEQCRPRRNTSGLCCGFPQSDCRTEAD